MPGVLLSQMKHSKTTSPSTLPVPFGPGFCSSQERAGQPSELDQDDRTEATHKVEPLALLAEDHLHAVNRLELEAEVARPEDARRAVARVGLDVGRGRGLGRRRLLLLLLSRLGRWRRRGGRS